MKKIVHRQRTIIARYPTYEKASDVAYQMVNVYPSVKNVSLIASNGEQIQVRRMSDHFALVTRRFVGKEE